jgi:hypothetical protein
MYKWQVSIGIVSLKKNKPCEWLNFTIRSTDLAICNGGLVLGSIQFFGSCSSWLKKCWCFKKCLKNNDLTPLI